MVENSEFEKLTEELSKVIQEQKKNAKRISSFEKSRSRIAPPDCIFSAART